MRLPGMPESKLMNLQKVQVVQWLKQLAIVFQENRNLLTQLDAEIGDADHGLNMNRGFDKVVEKLPTFEDKCLGTVLKNTGMTLLSSVGGASGPLYGTFFMKMATPLNSKEEVTQEELLQALEEGVNGIASRGKTNPNDKTMCDVWWPTLAAMKSAITQGHSLSETISLAAHAAKEAAAATIPMQARKGRASYLGKRSIGHQDPGATSSMLMVKTLHTIIAE